MIVIEDEAKVSIEEYEKEIKKLTDKEAGLKKELEEEKTKPGEKPVLERSLSKIKQVIKQKRSLVQLAKSSGASPASFPFITALYEAGLIYYFELDNETYKDYVKKIAKGQPVDVSDITYLPKRKQKERLEPIDFLNKNPKTSAYFTQTLRIKKFNTDDDKDSSSAEKIKYFYFGDLIQAILNNAKGTGIGQELDKIGSSEFAYLFGQIMWIKDEKTKILYNILNTPISLDMFLFEINREIYQKNINFMSLTYFLSTFMKRFFDLTIFAYEKAVSGQQNQKYFAGTSYVLDKDKFNSGSKFKRKLYDFVPTSDTKDTIVARLITAMPLEHTITPQIAKKRNIPKFYLGGPDRGPLKRLSFSVSPLQLQAEYLMAKKMRSGVGVKGKTVSEPDFDSMLVSSDTRLSLNLLGNVFFKVGDYIFMDSRFVDGGFFTQEENNIFFSGYFAIYSISHRFTARGEWSTQIDADFIGQTVDVNPSYKAFAGDVPRPQSVNVADGANLNRQNLLAPENSSLTSVDKKDSSTKGKAQASSAGSATVAPQHPPSVPKNL